ncbi:MAG: T9SS type A sorting domain-containing protein [Bacteroidales bacterium]|jgi:hypothetical protein|nr:T9SS type A sorting domain-containing protein [Bacteroidales bacterium]
MKKAILILSFLLFYFTSFSQFSGGDGSLSNPYKIKYVKDLITLSNNVINGNHYLNGYFIMVDDINFVSTTIDSSQFFSPIGGRGMTNALINRFKGNFNGDGYVVKNLTINTPDDNNTSLFGNIENATIQNIGVDNGYFVGSYNCGGLVGYATNSTIQNSFSKSYVSINNSSTASNCGGLVGFLNNSVINNCYAICNVNVNSNIINGNIGGLVGSAYYSSTFIFNSYSAPTGFSAPTNTRAGLFCGNLNTGATISNCFYSTTISGYDGLEINYSATSNLLAKTDAQLKDSSMIATLNSSQTTSPWTKDILSINNGFPVHTWQMNILKVFVQSVGHDSISLNVVYNDTNSVTSRGIVYKQSTLNTWDTINVLDTNFNCTLYNLVPNSDYHIKAFVVVGSDTIYSNIITARTSWQGDGTQNNPFIINNVKDLLIISNNVMNGTTYLGQYLKMSCDIDFNSSTVDSSQFFTPIGGWTSPTTNIISRVFQGNFDGNGHKILNLTVNKPGNGNVALFGYVKDNEIKNLGVVGCTFIGKTNVAGFVGHTNNSIITNCYSKSNIHATSDEQNATAGGMVGNFYGNSVMNNCFAEGTINASGIGMNVGGLIAYNSGSTIKNSYSRNRFYVTGGNSSLVGGLVGYNYASSVYNSYSAPILFDIPQLYNVRYSCFIGNVIAGGAIVNNYYSDSLSGFPGVYTGSSSGIYPKTYSQLKHFDIISIPSSLGNSLNFDSVPPCPWTIDTLTNMNDGYPVQIWQYHYPAKPIVDNIVVYIDSAYVHTQIISGTYPVISKGIEWRHADSLSWDTINMPVTDYSTTILNLAPNTNYEIRAFASTINETYYDSVRTFTTLHTPVVFGEVITQGVTNISDSSVSLNGTLVSVGNALDNIKIGFAYSTDFNVNIDSSNVDTVEVEYYEGITDFIKTLSNLVQQTYYYYKAFIINDAGISYGDIAGFWFEGLGLNNLETNSIFINLYPNPANDRVKLEVEGLNSEADVLVYDMVGRVIQTYKINQGTKELEIDLRGYAKGVYSIKIANENIYQTKKLIVQ